LFATLAMLLGACGQADSNLIPNTGNSRSSRMPLVDPTLANQLTNSCILLNSHDLARILATNELARDPVTVKAFDHPIFSEQPVSVNEVSCRFYEFHNPRKAGEELLQVTYWVDIPGQGVSSEAWRQSWLQAAASGQMVSGIGEQAFQGENGRLTFEQGNLYFTVEIVDPSRSAAQNEQISRLVAVDMIQRLTNLHDKKSPSNFPLT
jgi:hypothetical protein